MDEFFECECGNDEFTYLIHSMKIVCTKCSAKYGVIEKLMKNHKTNGVK
jgi:hypothetical protein